MPLIDRTGARLTDPWVEVETLDALPDGQATILPAEVFQENRHALEGRNAALGVRLKNDQPVADIADDLPKLDAVVLEFPAFKDGRAYSQARLLRQRYGFTGEIRATGDVLQDQAIFLVRCGFDCFEVDDQTAEAWQRALQRISVVYQKAADGTQPAPWRRHAPRAAE
ncbi:DUF934 domain-containing protein [Rhodovibrio salinarum]|uniref:DUF934 domain-containing protein n=1 Tax=Rhodovibrio salinarum TaxID=1087 RepID=A0A934QH45_9PROT|nr:DUF934 domain-containing protein [Rhodovibrio salinarum]MBK1696938.1 DUF934 domain-containing protein [Rhodovibrio salinarum]